MSQLDEIEARIDKLAGVQKRVSTELVRLERYRDRLRKVADREPETSQAAAIQASDMHLAAADPALVRRWAKSQGIHVPVKGRLPNALRKDYLRVMGLEERIGG